LAITDVNGNYSFELAGADYTLTPSNLGFTFNPPSQTFNNLSANQTVNFSGNRHSFVVTNANGHGTGSLRQAITDANAVPGADMIIFNIPGSGVQTITLLVSLPDITDPVFIDGTTQPVCRNSVDQLRQSDASNTNYLGLPREFYNSGLVINGFSSGSGLVLSGGSGNVIQGNYIGIDPTGTVGRANFIGISISNSANNLIGGVSSTARNVISSNSSDGVNLSAANNQIQAALSGQMPVARRRYQW
jgi:hypothetical protein